MGRPKELYSNRITDNKCGKCGRPARQKWDGTYYSLCDRCYKRQKNYEKRIAKGHSDFQRRETLCWKCQNAVPDKKKGTGCSWSISLKPVEGWTAQAVQIKLYENKTSPSFIVIACPMFKEGKKDADSSD